MNTTKFFAVATLSALAAIASMNAQAGETNSLQEVLQAQQPFQSTRGRTEVQAEAVTAASNAAAREEYDSSAYVTAAQKFQSERTRADVRSETVQALRLGQIVHGDALPL